MNKRFTSLMTTLILSVFFSISASAYDVEVDGIYYNLYTFTKEAKVTDREFKAGSYKGDITIPSLITIDSITYSVTSIEGFAFYNCNDLISVNIPNSITSIGGYAFYGCANLTSISIPNTIKKIEDYTFQNCI